ncbi:hypothetical protein CONPUDRAFT_39962, partial [Coniophora puteana RWD-64-598 SS2]
GVYCSDNDELKRNDLSGWLASQGTRQEFTAPHTSAQNGLVERLHLTLMNKARTM